MNSKFWKRTYTLDGDFHTARTEEWHDANGKSYPMSITYGKKTPLFSHTNPNLDDFNKHLKRCQNLCASLLHDEKNLEAVEKCALCGLSSKEATEDTEVHGMMYYKCPQCDLRYLKKRLSEQALDDFYKKDTVLSAIITNKELTKRRVKDIVMPKAEWVINTFESLYGRKPKKVIDVGAGGGHFVYAFRELGIDAIGIEPNKPSIDFCKDQFNLDLDPSDFLEYAKKDSDVEVISFIGLLEHLPEYMPFLHAARGMFGDRDGLVLSETPRRSLSSYIQGQYPNDVVRHMYPVSHIRIFTDSSIATSYTDAGFVPKAAWYFGMDTLVLTMQLARILESNDVIEKTGQMLLDIQPILDQAMLCDEIVFAAATR